jgi:hypothetical protein
MLPHRDGERMPASARTACLVAAYHEAQLAELLEHVAEALGRYRVEELDAFEVDVIHRYTMRTSRSSPGTLEQLGAEMNRSTGVGDSRAREDGGETS